ncbi:acyltransferase family protein [Acidisoma sp.]|uniref:acyltransferase family protein n=1 Tax=Acidisoma sp. TaxID=1872115 RepID=UPI003B003CD8
MQLQVRPAEAQAIAPQQLAFNALTGLRAIAAVWVIAYHYRSGVFSSLGATHILPVLGFGYLGVDLFFILSGFVIYHVHGQEMARPTIRIFLRFICLRAARLYPVYLFTLAIFASMVWLIPAFGFEVVDPSHYPLQHLILSILLVQTWGLTRNLTWNFPAWSVSAEWFCYLLFPLAAVIGTRLSRGAMMLGIILLLVTVTVVYLTSFNLTMNQAIGWRALVRATTEFSLGCLLRGLQHRVRTETWPWTGITAGVAVVWAASFYTPLPVGVVAIPLFATLVLAGSIRGNVISLVLSWRPFVAIGAASYSLYLMQAPIEKGAADLEQFLSPSRPVQSAGIVGIYVALLAIGTTLVHLLVENPSRRWLRSRIDTYMPVRRPEEPR